MLPPPCFTVGMVFLGVMRGVGFVPNIAFSLMVKKLHFSLIWPEYFGRSPTCHIATPPFIFPFVLSCFPHTCFTSPHDYYVHLVFCSLHVCVGYCLLSRLARFRLGCAGFDLYPWFVAAGTLYLFVVLCAVSLVLWAFIFVMRLRSVLTICLSKVLLCSLISALLRLTSMHQLHPPHDIGWL